MIAVAKKAVNTSVAVMFAMSMLCIAPAAVAPVQTAEAASAKVYIAPHSGTKYHSTKYCRGLNRARSVKKVTLSKAKKLGYRSACKICAR